MVSPLSCALAESVLPNQDTVIVFSVESITIWVVWFPAGKVCIVPVQVPANFFDRTGAGVDTACDGVDARFVFDSTTRFAFGFADCSGAGVALSSVIGAGNRCAVTNSKQQAKQTSAIVRMSILQNVAYGTMNILPVDGSLTFDPEGFPVTSNKRRAVGS
jgi:hypothetical protein